MAKVKISTILDSSENGVTSYTGFGTLNENKIVFYEDKVKVAVKFDNNMIELERSTDEYTISLLFENSLTKEGIYDIKCDSMQIPIKVTTHVLDIQDGLVHVEYNLLLGGVSQGKFVYDIKYEVII